MHEPLIPNGESVRRALHISAIGVDIKQPLRQEPFQKKISQTWLLSNRAREYRKALRSAQVQPESEGLRGYVRQNVGAVLRARSDERGHQLLTTSLGEVTLCFLLADCNTHLQSAYR